MMTVVLLTLGLIYYVTGSSVKLSASEMFIKPNLTPNMTLRCSIPTDNSGLTTPAGGSVVGRRGTPTWSMDIGSITSLTISHDGEDIAVVSKQGPPQVVSLSDKGVHVSGAIPGNNGEFGFIEVTWEYPGQQQVGRYVCRVNALSNATGQNVNISESLSVKQGEASIGELIDHIHMLEVKETNKCCDIHSLETKLQIQEAELKMQKSEIQTLKNDVKAADNEIKSLKSQTSTQETDIQSLKSALAEARHIETGYINCGAQHTWAGSRTTDVSQQFQTAYTKPPVVHLGVSQIDAQNNLFTWFSLTLKSVDTNGFVMNCEGMPDIPNHSQFYTLRAQWISVPNQ